MQFKNLAEELAQFSIEVNLTSEQRLDLAQRVANALESQLDESAMFNDGFDVDSFVDELIAQAI